MSKSNCLHRANSSATKSNCGSQRELKRVYLQWRFGDSRQVSTTSKSSGVWSAPQLMENRVRRVYPRWEFITAPPTRRSPLAEGRTGLPNPCVAIEHHWFALPYCISFSSLHSCSVTIVASDQSQSLCWQSIFLVISYHLWLFCFVILLICDFTRDIFIHHHFSEWLSFAAMTCYLYQYLCMSWAFQMS